MSRHIHLDLVGGMAGDMFAAAMLDTFPNLEEALRADLTATGLDEHVRVSDEPVLVNGIAARRFSVEHTSDNPRPTRHYRDIRVMLENSGLATAVRDRAIEIFNVLAEAESNVHKVDRDAVHFHEIADWDSITDIVAAASLITHCGAQSYSCSSVPLGRGLVKTEHGAMPVPAPATTLILQGFVVRDDGESGERVTPTGAAILRYLVKDPGAAIAPGSLTATGAGGGNRRFDSLPNIVRLLVVETATTGGMQTDEVSVIAFEVDDMTPEELALALDHLRAGEGVLDVSYQVRFGKKGRPQFAIQVITTLCCADAVAQMCCVETATLGVRIGVSSRRILQRENSSVDVSGQTYAAKRAWRPDGAVTTKIEADEIAPMPAHHRRRQISAAASGQFAVDNEDAAGHTTTKTGGGGV